MNNEIYINLDEVSNVEDKFLEFQGSFLYLRDALSLFNYRDLMIIL